MFLREKRHKKWNQKCYKNSLSSSIFVIFFFFWPTENNIVVPCFWNWFFSTQEKLEKFHQEVFTVSYLLKIRSWISQFSKQDNIWTYDIIKQLKIINFRAAINFTWIIIAPFIFMHLADLCVYAMINFVPWQNTKYR